MVGVQVTHLDMEIPANVLFAVNLQPTRLQTMDIVTNIGKMRLDGKKTPSINNENGVGGV